MAALSFIGKSISLISHSDVRYKGILAGIDHRASTIQLSNVYSMGTESRKPVNEFIPPVPDPYTYIIFRASEVKDLAVDESEAPPPRSVHDDPAVIGVSGSPYPAPPFQRQPSSGPSGPASTGAAQGTPFVNPQQPPAAPTAQVQVQANGTPAAQPPRAAGRNNSVNSATASLETIERAIDDLRVSNGSAGANGHGAHQQQQQQHPQQHHRGGRRGGGSNRPQGILPVPVTDFDFESSNARFDKASLAPKSDGDGATVDGTPGSEKDEDSAYNPKKSFFDSLSSGSNGPSGDGRGRGGRRGGRNRREEERERNVATFGEPGGVGLMGPGAYVGGWGYGRRGGNARGRRGGSVAGSRS